MQEKTVTDLEQIIEDTVEVMRTLSKEDNQTLFGFALAHQGMNLVARTKDCMTNIKEAS